MYDIFPQGVLEVIGSLENKSGGQVAKDLLEQEEEKLNGESDTTGNRVGGIA